MTESAGPAIPDSFWGVLMSSLEQGQVIPCLGRDLLEVHDNGVSVPLDHVVARRALALIGLGDACERALTLHDAAVCCLTSPGGEEHLRNFYWAVDKVVSDPTFPIPEMLTQLASIDAFRLYVTTAFDPLLARSIDSARRGAARTRSYAYALHKRPDDLPAPIDDIREPVVYHLFGRSSAFSTLDYALTEEDTLEFMQALRSRADAPETLFAEMLTRSILIIGSGYSDWLTRFFLRVTRGRRLRESGPPSGWIADTSVHGDQPLVQFLRHFSGPTYRIVPGEPREFVRELASRWAAHTASKAVAIRDPQEPPPIDPESVFVSYARDDTDAVLRLVNALRAVGLPVWFDQNVFRGGEDFDRDITAEISRCSLFIPVLSRRALTVKRRYVFSEWKGAIKISDQFLRTFIVPCAIDDVPRDAEPIPPAIRALHIQDIRSDADLAKFVQHVKGLFRKFQLAESSP